MKMNKFNLVFYSITAGFCLSVFQAHGQNISETERIATSWEDQLAYMVEVLEAMPEHKLNYKPNDETRSFKEVFIHFVSISHVIESILKGNDVNQAFGKVKAFSEKSYNKTELKSAIEVNMKHMIAAIRQMSSQGLNKSNPMPFLPDQAVKTNRELLSVMSHHVAHHRGQATVYLRLNDIKPPSYKNWF